MCDVCAFVLLAQTVLSCTRVNHIRNIIMPMHWTVLPTQPRQVLYLHMRLNKPDMITGAVSYEQRYSVSSWASEEPIDYTVCEDGCTSECNIDDQCVELAQGIVTDRVIQCPSNEQ